MPDVLIETLKDGVLTLMLNRPQQRNALSAQLRQRLADAVVRAACDDAVRVVLLCGAGTHFCVGADVQDMAAPSAKESASTDALVTQLRQEVEAVRLLHDMDKPTIAAVQGAAAGGGLGLALACDLRIASAATKFTTGFGRVGLSGDYGCSYFLTWLVGTTRSRELCFTSAVIDGAGAANLGLVTRLVPDGQVQEAAYALACSLAQGPRTALACMKQNLNEAEHTPLAEHLAAETRRHILTVLTPDHREGVAAFLEKRRPRFEGI